MANKRSDERIYESDDWRERRLRENNWYDWYSGKNLAEAEDNAVDSQTGERAKLYPLQITPIAKVCRVHRSVLFGMPSNYDTPLVQLVIKPASNRAPMRDRTGLVIGVIPPSRGGNAMVGRPIFFRAGGP